MAASQAQAGQQPAPQPSPADMFIQQKVEQNPYLTHGEEQILRARFSQQQPQQPNLLNTLNSLFPRK